ncbi:MAG: SDR family oxidoreductase [Saprospiraceae bacterium]|nr:SDR family oxidoreductase [Saprospiraceae bacterium]
MKRIMLITGGSTGIGAATALLAAQLGYAVAINYRKNKEAAQQVVATIREGGGKAIAVQADLAMPDQIQALFQTVDKEMGTLDVLVNNAALLEPQARFNALDYERLQRIFAVNVLGVFVCSQEACARMSTSKGGRGGSIINISSMAAKLGAPFEYIDYASTKGAMDTMTIGLAKEVATEGIRVNGIRPGIIQTDIHAKGGEPDRINRVKASVPMQRGGTADEVAEAILWLASDKASYVTGSIMDVSGGR